MINCNQTKHNQIQTETKSREQQDNSLEASRTTPVRGRQPPPEINIKTMTPIFSMGRQSPIPTLPHRTPGTMPPRVLILKPVFPIPGTPTTSKAPTTTEAPTTSKAPTTTEAPTTTKAPRRSEAPQLSIGAVSTLQSVLSSPGPRLGRQTPPATAHLVFGKLAKLSEIRLNRSRVLSSNSMKSEFVTEASSHVPMATSNTSIMTAHASKLTSSTTNNASMKAANWTLCNSIGTASGKNRNKISFVTSHAFNVNPQVANVTIQALDMVSQTSNVISAASIMTSSASNETSNVMSHAAAIVMPQAASIMTSSASNETSNVTSHAAAIVMPQQALNVTSGGSQLILNASEANSVASEKIPNENDPNTFLKFDPTICEHDQASYNLKSCFVSALHFSKELSSSTCALCEQRFSNDKDIFSHVQQTHRLVDDDEEEDPFLELNFEKSSATVHLENNLRAQIKRFLNDVEHGFSTTSTLDITKKVK